jgi:gamma-glutamyltranspeptidase/glutathione hydrolase
LPAADIAEQGFSIDRVFAANVRSNQANIAKFPATRALLLHPDGSPLKQGDVLKQPDLARTYRMTAAEGIDWFYRGPFAETVGKWMAENGGMLSAGDFAAYQPRSRQPLVTNYRGYKIVGFPPPSSGGVHVAEILNVLESFDLQQIQERDPVQFVHVVAEAMKLAFADRAHWLGDPEFARVPRGLIDREYASQLAKRIDLTRATKVAGHGIPPLADSQFFSKHTTHVAAVDSEGYWVGITATINTSFGSKVIVPGTGVVLNNQMDDFSIQPGVPNAFGLVGAEANAIAPGKRPLSSMSPTIVLRDDQPILTIGAAGGPTIINQVVQGIVRHLDLRMPLDQAVALPRFHHQWTPDVLTFEATFPSAMVEHLTERGHASKRRETIGVSQAIGLAEDGKTFVGVHDPRVPGKAAGP